jgi:hypothetical protein
MDHLTESSRDNARKAILDFGFWILDSGIHAFLARRAVDANLIEVTSAKMGRYFANPKSKIQNPKSKT